MANRKYAWSEMEARYIESDDISIRELARQYGVTNASMAHEYARRHKWVEKREMRKMRTEQKLIEKAGDRVAARQDKLEDLVDTTIDTIQALLDKLGRDIREKPSEVKVTPKDLALLADRILVLRGQPSQITEERNLGLTLAGSVGSDQIAAILEATRGVTVSQPDRPRGSAIPRVASGGED